MNTHMYNSLLNNVPWYKDKNLVYHREIVVDKNTHVSAFGYPVSIFNPNGNGLKFNDIEGQLIFRFKNKGERNYQYKLEIVQNGLFLEKIDLKDFYLRPIQSELYTWKDIKQFIQWRNRFNEQV